MIRQHISELYDDLKYPNSKSIQGQLTIEGFEDSDYEELYFEILELVKPYIEDDFEYWFTKKCREYHKHKCQTRRNFSGEFYDPHFEKSMHEMTIREQLCVLKYFLYRRTYSGFKARCE